MIVAIDGPAASGKTTTAHEVARRLGFAFLCTGNMYRSVALAFLRRGAPPTREAAVELLPTMRLETPLEGGVVRMVLDGDDVTDRLSGPDIAKTASGVATLRVVRRELVKRQRLLGRLRTSDSGLVVEGRDIGTVVFPEAEVKIYMEAAASVRARRRREELLQRGRDVAYEVLLSELLERDRQDRARDHSPLRAAADAVILDTSRRSREDQIRFILDRVWERRR